MQDAITALLRERGLNRTDFARRVGLDKATLSRLEHRKPTRLPKKLNVDRWIAALDLSREDAKRLRLAAELSWSPVGVQDLVRQLLKAT